MRVNLIIMSQILPFNFGMDYQDWVTFYKNNQDFPAILPLTNPEEWDKETVDKVNSNARKENEIYDYLVRVPQESFNEELKRFEGLDIETIWNLIQAKSSKD